MNVQDTHIARRVLLRLWMLAYVSVVCVGAFLEALHLAGHPFLHLSCPHTRHDPSVSSHRKASCPNSPHIRHPAPKFITHISSSSGAVPLANTLRRPAEKGSATHPKPLYPAQYPMLHFSSSSCLVSHLWLLQGKSPANWRANRGLWPSGADETRGQGEGRAIQ